MEFFLGRFKNLIILMGRLVPTGTRAGGTGQARQRSSEYAPDPRLGRGAITPLERGLVWIQNGTGNIWHNYFYLRGVRAENRDLRNKSSRCASSKSASARTRPGPPPPGPALVKEQFVSRTVAAQVIGHQRQRPLALNLHRQG